VLERLDSTDHRLSVEPIEGELAGSGLAQAPADEKLYEKLLAE
jgi:hypothetical protein